MPALTSRLFSLLVFCLAAALLSLPVFAGGNRDFARPGVLVGQDNDNLDNPVFQPDGVAVNQTLDNGDILQGLSGDDVAIGLLGADTILGQEGNDILIGGPEAFVAPNKDIILGGSGDDINIWAPGDGSDAFEGGEGTRDVQVFGRIDLDDDGVPLLTPAPGRERTGVPSVDVTGSPGFCRLDKVDRREEGFGFLVRFFVRSSGNLAVSVRLNDVEQIFCTSEIGGEIIYANLRTVNPTFRVVTLAEVATINPEVAKIIR